MTRSEPLDGQPEPLDARWMGATVRVPDHITHREFPQETVLLDLRTGTYHGLDHGAGRILRALDEIGDVAEVTRRLAAELATDASRMRSEVCRLCQALFDRGAIEKISRR